MSNSYFEKMMPIISNSIKIRGGKSKFTLLRWHIRYFNLLANEIKNQNPNLNSNEVKAEIKKKVMNMITKYTLVKLSLSHVELTTLMYYLTVKKYSSTPEDVDKLYERVITEDFKEVSEYYTSTYDFINKILRGHLGINSSEKFYDFMDKDEFQWLFKEMFTPYMGFGEFRIPDKKLHDIFKGGIKKVKNLNSDLLREYYIVNLLVVVSFLEETKQMEKYISFNNANLRKFSMGTLAINLGEPIQELSLVKWAIDKLQMRNGSFDYQGIDVMDFILEIDRIPAKPIPKELTFRDGFRVQYLKSMSVNEILVLNSFWQNKLSKEIKNLFRAFLMADSLDLFDGIIDGKITDNNIEKYVNDEDYEHIMEKSEFILKCAKRKHKMCEEIPNCFMNYYENNRYLTQEASDSQMYQEYFKDLSANNSLGDDLKAYMPIYRAIEAAYYSKNLSTYSFIFLLDEMKNLKNYGIALSGKNVEDYENNICVICIDCPRIIAPLKIHIEKDNLIEFLSKSKGNTSFPIYRGFEDFSLGKDFFSSNILIPMGKGYSDKLKSYAKSCDEKSQVGRLATHLSMLANGGRVPNHFKETKANGEKVFMKSYIDLVSGVTFRDEKKSFYKMEDFKTSKNE